MIQEFLSDDLERGLEFGASFSFAIGAISLSFKNTSSNISLCDGGGHSGCV